MQKFLFFSGGTALNTIESIFKTFTDAVYVLPISDNGGSSSVIMDVIGGPSIGDIRSRIVRLADDSTVEARAVSSLLMYRLPLDSDESKREWLSIVEGTHDLWSDISEPYKETIRAFLVHFNTEVLRQANKKQFTFSCGSVGNFFLTGARIFFNSLETSLFWFSRVVRIPSNSSVMPIINTNSTIHIGVELENGVIIHGQHEISHPTSSTSLSSPRFHSNPLPPSPRLYHPQLAFYLQRLQHSPQHLFYPPSFPVSAFNNPSLLPSSQYPHSPSSYSSRSFSPRPPQPAELHSLIPPPSPTPASSSDSSSPTKISQLHRSASLPTNSLLPNENLEQQKKAAQHNNLVVDKNGHTPLEAKIKRLFYLNEDRQEILPPCNPTVLAKIRQQDTIVYSIGSLWTSIIPCLVLKGVGEEISAKKGRKVLILNGYPDRETHNFTARDYVSAITAALNRYGTLNHPASKYLTHLIWVEGSKVEVDADADAMRAQGIACVRIARSRACAEDTPMYDEALLVQCLADLGSHPSTNGYNNGSTNGSTNVATNGNGSTHESNGNGSTNGNHSTC